MLAVVQEAAPASLYSSEYEPASPPASVQETIAELVVVLSIVKSNGSKQAGPSSTIILSTCGLEYPYTLVPRKAIFTFACPA